MRCPKCRADMQEQRLVTRTGEICIDKCSRCAGLWFDMGEASRLKDDWIAVTIDDGDVNVGKIYNEITEIDCPRCFQPMNSVNDEHQPHLRYEICKDHGVFMDAGEFSDFRDISLREAFDRVLELYRQGSQGDTPDPSKNPGR